MSRIKVPRSGQALTPIPRVELEATGNGGKLALETESLSIVDGGQVAVTTFGDGNVGNLDVMAEVIELIGTSADGNPSGLFSNVESTARGNGGQIQVDVDTLNITDGAQISGITLGGGIGGDIDIQANEIELIGISPNTPSGFQSTVAPSASGNGGNLAINTESLKVTNGGQIAVSTAGIGQGGELVINADEIELVGRSEFGASGIFGNAIIGTGDGGNLEINTNILTILDGATISASNFSSRNNSISPGSGKAGSIAVNANTLKLDTASGEVPSSITASTNSSGGGNIDLAIAEDITIANNSEIDGDTQGASVGGNIKLRTNNLRVNNQGRISVDSTGEGNAGNIEILANNLNSNNGSVTATSDNSGGGDIELTTDYIVLDRSELSTSVSDGTGGGGNLKIDSNFVIAKDNSNIIAKANRGDGGNIDITTKVFLRSPDSLVDASSQSGVDGAVDINSLETEGQIDLLQLPDQVRDPTALISAVCPKDGVNTLSTIGKGGLAENPSQNLRGRSVWEDLRNFVDDTSDRSTSSNTTKDLLEQSLVFSQKLDLSEESSNTLFSLGNNALALGDKTQAINYYQQAAATTAQPLLETEAQLNQLGLLITNQQWQSAQDLLPKIQTQLADFSSTSTRRVVYAQVNLAKHAIELTNHNGDRNLFAQTENLLKTSIQQADKLKDPQSKSYAVGMLGHLSESDRQIDLGREYTRKAVQLAQTINNSELTYQWQWQLGRLLQTNNGNQEGAIASYTEAVNALESLRSDLVVTNANLQFSFREQVEPVYRELVSLLLTPVDNQPVSRGKLLQARNTIESLQLAELNNFFREACLDATPTDIDEIDRQAAVIYPIILGDRLEVIVSLPDKSLIHYAKSIPQTELESVIKELRQTLQIRNRRKFYQPAEKLYSWLIKPTLAALTKHKITTLVFVTDGSFRNIP